MTIMKLSDDFAVLAQIEKRIWKGSHRLAIAP